MNTLQEQGRACYKRGDYKRAVELFDRAIGRSVSVQLLDNRAACHEKLDNLQAALKDAKQIIQLSREDPTGYLRAGKVLLKMDKSPVALEIYTHGLRCVKHVGQGYELLRKAHMDLMNKMSPPKSVDPLTVLPRELAETILEYLSFKQRMNACFVSKSWTQFIRSCPDLWRHLDLTHTRGKVKNAFISRAINVGRHKLCQVTLANLWDFDKALAALIRNCPIESMTLLGTSLQGKSVNTIIEDAKQLKKLTLGPDILLSLKEISSIMTALSNRLEELDCRRIAPVYEHHHACEYPMFPQMRLLSVNLRDASHLTFRPFITIATQRAAALESLSMQVSHPHMAVRSTMLFPCAHMHLTTLDITVPGMRASQMQLPPSLIRLHVRSAHRLSNDFWMEPSPNGLEPTTFHLPNLEELHLEVWAMIIHNALFALGGKDSPAVAQEENATTPSKLRKLSIVGAKLNYLSISELFQHPRLCELEELCLPRLESCCDEDVKGIVESLPKLHSLDLSENNITGVGVRRIVEASPVKDLIVDSCHSIGLDAIQWARSSGLKVQHRLSEGQGCSKIRH